MILFLLVISNEDKFSNFLPTTLNSSGLFDILFRGQYSDESLRSGKESCHVYEKQAKVNAVSVNHEDFKK